MKKYFDYINLLLDEIAFIDEYINMDQKIVARNRKAAHDFFLFEKFEAGIVLQGSEIKSIRNGQISIAEAYVQIDGRQSYLIDAHIAPYDHSGIYNHDPKRPRKLLLHKNEIIHLWNEIRRKGITLIPTLVYLKNGRAKVEIAIAKGKKLFDKRQEIAKRDTKREINRNFRRRG